MVNVRSETGHDFFFRGGLIYFEKEKWGNFETLKLFLCI